MEGKKIWSSKKCPHIREDYVVTTILLQNVPLSFLKSRASSLSVTISFMFIMLLWLSWRKILISLMAVIGKPSFSLSSRTFFKATISAMKQRKELHLKTRSWAGLTLNRPNDNLHFQSRKNFNHLYFTCTEHWQWIHVYSCDVEFTNENISSKHLPVSLSLALYTCP